MNPARDIGNTAVNVGHTFQTGGDYGLTLYALILCAFFLFLFGIIVIGLLIRALANSQRECAKQSERFASTGEVLSTALRDLATAQTARIATDHAHHTELARVLGRLESYLTKVEPHGY